MIGQVSSVLVYHGPYLELNGGKSVKHGFGYETEEFFDRETQQTTHRIAYVGDFQNGDRSGVGQTFHVNQRLRADGIFEFGGFVEGKLFNDDGDLVGNVKKVGGSKGLPELIVTLGDSQLKGVFDDIEDLTARVVHETRISDGSLLFVGQIENGMRKKGLAYYREGGKEVKFQGDFKNGRFAEGKIFYPDGSVLDGSFDNDGLFSSFLNSVIILGDYRVKAKISKSKIIHIDVNGRNIEYKGPLKNNCLLNGLNLFEEAGTPFRTFLELMDSKGGIPKWGGSPTEGPEPLMKTREMKTETAHDGHPVIETIPQRQTSSEDDSRPSTPNSTPLAQPQPCSYYPQGIPSVTDGVAYPSCGYPVIQIGPQHTTPEPYFLAGLQHPPTPGSDPSTSGHSTPEGALYPCFYPAAPCFPHPQWGFPAGCFTMISMPTAMTCTMPAMTPGIMAVPQGVYAGQLAPSAPPGVFHCPPCPPPPSGPPIIYQ